VFPSPQGHVWNKDNFNSRVWRPGVARSGLDGITFHSLRHTFAALAIDSGAHMKVLQALMGHASIRITMDIYGHLYEATTAAAIRSLGTMLDASSVAVRSAPLEAPPSMPHRVAAGYEHDERKTPLSWGVLSGSDGTRTRDLPRDRPSPAHRRSTTNVAERPHLQVLLALGQTPLRMVEPDVRETFGPRVGHQCCQIRRHSVHSRVLRRYARACAHLRGPRPTRLWRKNRRRLRRERVVSAVRALPPDVAPRSLRAERGRRRLLPDPARR
jgi:Phage integrase family